MGSNTSKPAIYPGDNRDVEKYSYHDESVDEALYEKICNLHIEDSSLEGTKGSESKGLSLSSVYEWESSLLSDKKNLLTIAALGNHSVAEVVKSTKRLTADSVDVWNTKVDLEGSPVTSQNASGRCWIFASTNVFRTFYQKKFNLEEFELSQAYLFFYDKLEKANYLLNNVIETSDLKLESRVVQAILSNGLSDGGQWDMIVNLVSKYGLIPKTVYKDSFHASNTAPLNYFLVNKLKEDALILRKLVNNGSSKEKIQSIKQAQVREIYNILALSLGPAPKPDEKFTWDFKTKSGAVKSITVTPTEFAELVDLQIHGTYSLINDPRHDYNKLYTVDRLNNVVGGKPIDYINVPTKVLKEVLITSLKNNQPVFFGSDVGKFSDREAGILDTDAYDYDLVFNTSLKLTKAERLQVGSSVMTHAMVITAVHIVDGRIERYRIENSWGPDAGNKGYYVATDAWFDEYVYQVVTNTKFAPQYLTDIWKAGDYTVLPIYDPMGSLA